MYSITHPASQSGVKIYEIDSDGMEWLWREAAARDAWGKTIEVEIVPPENPSEGDTYTDINNQTWVYVGHEYDSSGHWSPV